MAYDNKGRCGLWRNKDRKEMTHPHLSGQGEDLNGNPVWASAWFSKDLQAGDKAILADMVQRYEGTSQKPFINVVIRTKQQPAAGGGISTEAVDDKGQFNNGEDDDIPF